MPALITKKEGADLSSGQALLIVLLSMAVVLTVVLSVLSRSVTDIAVTSRGEESIRAFSAAEAGVEQVLIGQGTSGTFEGSEFDAEVAEVAEGQNEFKYPTEVAMGDTATIWFVAHDQATGNIVCNSTHPCFTGNSLKLCWGSGQNFTDDALRPAVEVSVYYQTTATNPGTARIARAVYDSNQPRTSTNNFAAANVSNCTIEGHDFPFNATINLGTGGLNIPTTVTNTQGGLRFAQIRFLYNSDRAHPFGVSVASGAFPTQGQKISSVGTSGEATRKVEVYKLYSDLPTAFASAVFSPAGISK